VSVLTLDVQHDSEINLGFRVHLTLVDAGVSFLHVGNAQIPVVAVLRMAHAETGVSGVCVDARGQDVEVAFTHPGYLQQSIPRAMSLPTIYTGREINSLLSSRRKFHAGSMRFLAGHETRHPFIRRLRWTVYQKAISLPPGFGSGRGGNGEERLSFARQKPSEFLHRRSRSNTLNVNTF
jgi:hypothetical protein